MDLARYHYSSTNDNGQITSMDDGRLNYTIGYQYDALKRLVNASATGHWTQSYSYDGFGNLTAKSVPSGSAEPSFPGVNPAKNWLTGVTYDANGNTTTGIGNQTLSYDIENRMIQSTVGTASTVYAYDEGNHRIAKTFGTNNPIVYFHDPASKLMASFAATSLGLQSSSYRIYFGAMLLGTTTGSGSGGSAHADRLGTYNPGYPYGTDAGLYGVPPDDAPYFATYTKDAATGFEYANNRYYSAGYGRFLTADPSRTAAGPQDPSSWNRYAYTRNDPVNRLDPTGTEDCDADWCATAYGMPDGVDGSAGGESGGGGQTGRSKNVSAGVSNFPECNKTGSAKEDSNLAFVQDSYQDSLSLAKQFKVPVDLILGLPPRKQLGEPHQRPLTIAIILTSTHLAHRVPVGPTLFNVAEVQ